MANMLCTFLKKIQKMKPEFVKVLEAEMIILP